ncbi:MAG: protein kinase [Oscillospiraceae bacterium]|nr:protein kinase [Oscillospiraceae bacterium]
MPEPKLITPLLDSIMVGDAISDHYGIRCYPAMHTVTNRKYILKIISVPSSATQLEALLLTGALENQEAAKKYFQQRAKELTDEIAVLQGLSRQEGFLPFSGCQVVEMEDSVGYEIYILSEYRLALDRYTSKHPLSQLDAINLGLDICSSLTACRRSGFIFVNLKPSNIFINDNGEYRISDLGLIPLNALKYAALPQHYIGNYTAPEVTDPFAALNETIDVYALGMILYGIYNDGVLPEDRTVPFPAPAYADQELSEIIMKACSIDEKDRWQDPAQMGQMLVGYMQKNGANDIPIIPPAAEPEPEPEPELEIEPEFETEPAAEPVPESEVIIFSDNSNYENISIDEMIGIIDAIEESDEDGEISDEPQENALEDLLLPAVSPDKEAAKDDSGEENVLQDAEMPNNVSDESPDIGDTAPEDKAVTLEYEDLSEEISIILSQADALAEMEVPDPVVAPDPETVTLPDISQEISEEGKDEIPADQTEEDTTMKNYEYTDDEYFTEEEPKRPSHWIRNTVIIALLLLLLGGGILFYTLYVAKSVDQLQVTGNGDDLTVTVSSNADDSLLTVSCINTQTQVVITVPVSNGKAEFTGLSASSKYTITVNISGLHILTGNTQAEYATPAETTIVQYDVEIGETPGTVKITFAVNGPDSERWSFTYSAQGQQPVTEAVTGHSFTLKGLKDNQKYTGILEPEKNLMIKDPLEITFTASELIRAKDLKIISCFNGSLTAQWSAPESVAVESWFARCYNENYDQTVNIKNTTATFRGLNSSEGFTVEVWAQGQTAKQTQIVAENSITIENFSAELSSAGAIELKWDAATAPQGGWIVSYMVDDSETYFEYSTTINKALIAPVAPGCKYTFTVAAADQAVTTFCQEQTCMVPAAEESFTLSVNNRDIDQDDLQIDLCKRPASGNWSQKDAVYTLEFDTNEKAGLVVFLKTKYEKADQDLDVTLVIKNEVGELVDISATTVAWDQIWVQNYYTLNLPSTPSTPGCYHITLYFNNMTVFETDFAVS